MRAITAALVALVLAGAVFLMASPPAQAEVLRCDIIQKYHCTIGTGCEPQPLERPPWNEIDLSERTFARCDKKGCDRYDAVFSWSGAFVVIDLPGKGAVAKLSLLDGSFTEVVTLMNVVFTSFGSCQ